MYSGTLDISWWYIWWSTGCRCHSECQTTIIQPLMTLVSRYPRPTAMDSWMVGLTWCTVITSDGKC